jgi:hypothetical protein
VVEVSAADLAVDGAPVAGTTPAERAAKFRDWVTGWALPDAQKPPSPLYVAAAAAVDVQTLRAFLVHVPDKVEVRLLVRVPKAPASAKGGESAGAREVAVKVLSEPYSTDLRARLQAEYADLSRCPAVTNAVSSVSALDSRARWPALQTALTRALPSCDCNGIDGGSLRLLVSAEQRAGAASLGWVPLSYLKDERCGASMPLRSVDKLVKQLEQFDEEFSAQFQSDAVTFKDVLEVERLRVYFCDALPGETVAALANAHATLYLPTGGRSCDAWTFTPLSLGAPMGTLSRAAGSGSDRGTFAFHYWQAAEDFRVFGPVDAAAPSKPTDEKDWACEETLHLTGVDERAIHLGELTWFFDESTCLRAPETARGLSGCAATRAAGSTPAP